MAKKEIDQLEYIQRIKKYYDATKVQVRLGDLDKVMRAASKMLRTAIELDNYTGSGLCVDTEEMAEAYKNINELLKPIQDSAKLKAEERVNNHYELKK